MSPPLCDIHLLSPEEKAAAYLDLARAAGDIEDFDRAIALYLASLRNRPGNLGAHQALREIARHRKATGGRPLGLTDRLRQLVVRNPNRRMLDAARILAYDPADTDAMSELLESARAAGHAEVADWIEPLLHRALHNTQR